MTTNCASGARAMEVAMTQRETVEDLTTTRKRRGIEKCGMCGRKGEVLRFTATLRRRGVQRDMKHVIHKRVWHGFYWTITDSCMLVLAEHPMRVGSKS